MKIDLSEVKAIIRDLQEGIEKRRQIREGIKHSNPEWDELSDENWKNTKSRCWIHGATKVGEANELEQWLFDNPPFSETSLENAAKCVQLWRQWLEIEDAYYGLFEDFEFDEPFEDETLRDFIVRMGKIVESEGKGARLEWRALKSFLAYLRNIAQEEIAFIEQIFPKKMDLFHGRIIRRIRPEVYPISENFTGDILIELARMCLDGRPNIQHTAAEALGLSWLCLTASRLRLPTYLETMIYPTKSSALLFEGEFPQLLAPTFFSDRKIRISERVAKYLHALSLIPSKRPRETILQKPYDSLRRTFRRALKRISPPLELGQITFLTLLSPPHPFEGNFR